MCSAGHHGIFSTHVDFASRGDAATRKIMRNSIIAALVLVLSGCGDGALTLNTGVSPKVPLSDVTDDEAMKICLAVVGYIDDLLPRTRVEQVVCTMAGVGAEAALGGSGQCEVTRDQCLEDPPAVESIADGISCDSASADAFADCEGATVGDIEQCFSDLGKRLDSILDQITCSKLGGDSDAADALTEELTTAFDDANQPESCRRLSEACPAANIFG
jgi:hypothetical protein